MQRANAVKRMVAELTLVRMCDPALDTSAESLLARVERLEDAVAAGTPIAAAPTPQKNVEPTPEVIAPAPTLAVSPQVTPTAPPTATHTRPQPEIPVAPKSEITPSTGRVLHRIRGFMNCIERIRRENTMLASFLDGRAFLDDDGHVILQLTNSFAPVMIDNQKDREAICRAIAPEIKKSITPSDILFEIPSEKATATDTVLDDLLDAAGEQ